MTFYIDQLVNGSCPKSLWWQCSIKALKFSFVPSIITMIIKHFVTPIIQSIQNVNIESKYSWCSKMLMMLKRWMNGAWRWRCWRDPRVDLKVRKWSYLYVNSVNYKLLGVIEHRSMKVQSFLYILIQPHLGVWGNKVMCKVDKLFWSKSGLGILENRWRWNPWHIMWNL